mgnify:CR=1 FL=1
MFVQYEKWSRRKSDFDVVTEPLAEWLTDHMNSGRLEDKIRRVCAITTIMAAEFLKAHPEKFEDVLYHLEGEEGVRHKLVENQL